ncbi:uncharacterized protein [Diadema antillarum]|uniref:uncharacterized protein n=1 Tax=Diadema antillarum TaxID=105358 RepID=UPI003A8951E8
MEEDIAGLDENGNAKRLKPGEDDEEELSKDAIITSSWGGSVPLQRPSAFRPWSPSILNKEGKGGILPDHGTVLVRDRSGMPTYLSMGPPVLLNPERVVPHTAASKFDSQFAPNVALAPPMKLSPSSTESLSPDREKELDIKCEDSDVPETTMEQEIEMVKTMLLEGDALDSRGGREKLLHEFYRIRIRHEERLQGVLAAKRNLQQELEFLRLTKKDKLREALESKRSLRKELDRLRIEYERKLREANDSRQRLKREVEQARSRRSEKNTELGRSHDRLASQNEQLRDRVRELEEERDQLRQELEQHRRERRRRRPNGLEKEMEKEEGDAEEKELVEDGAESQSTATKGAERREEGEKEESPSPSPVAREAASPETREGRGEGASRKEEEKDAGEVEREAGEKKACDGDKRRDGSADQSHPAKKK